MKTNCSCHIHLFNVWLTLRRDLGVAVHCHAHEPYIFSVRHISIGISATTLTTHAAVKWQMIEANQDI